MNNNSGNTVNNNEVFLRIYDLSHGTAKVLSKFIIGFQVDGVWHTSIEVFGNEYFFHGGLAIQKAGTTLFNPCVDRVSMGATSCTKESLEEFFSNCKDSWNETNYDFFENNCNNFTDFLCNFLVGKGIPQEILDLPKKVRENEQFKKLFMMDNKKAKE